MKAIRRRHEVAQHSGSGPSRVTAALAVGATAGMVLCIVLGLFLGGVASFLLFGVAVTLAIYLVLISGAFAVDATCRRQPPRTEGTAS